jgi:hypothetical protein
MLTLKSLKKHVKYDPVTGVLTRLIRTSNRVCVGDVVGTNHGNGYLRVNINGWQEYAHRVAWFYMTGKMPKHEIDHKNGIRSDNRWKNIREATRRTNMENQRGARADNKSTGLIGAYKCRGKFRASIQTRKKQIHIGVFDTAMEAHLAYLNKKRILHAGCQI